MSIAADVTIGIHSTGGLVLSRSLNMEVGSESTFPSEAYFHRQVTVDRHPDTDDVVSNKSAWLVAANTASIASGEHVKIVFKCSDDADMTAVEDAMEGTEPFFVTRYTFDSTAKTVTAYADGSAHWELTDWSDPHIPYVPDWDDITIRALLADSSLFCVMPYSHRYAWSRRVKPVLSGVAETIVKDGDNCYILSLFGDITISGTVHPHGQFVRLTSDSVVATPSADTIIMKVYR